MKKISFQSILRPFKTLKDVPMKSIYRLYEKRLWSEIKNFKNPPHHLAIILDGNRRYARKLGKETKEGHDFGVENYFLVT
ncbi:MAG: (2Z,6E)-farnesyl diphosphate synthase [Candidatus Heimdallarchaeota archaeon LC_3]|nr:MAG: (2Z,6E)-farnesyl diphosphate synthase [Candidatus Heimdallarchaeota archaeon LC_3]